MQHPPSSAPAKLRGEWATPDCLTVVGHELRTPLTLVKGYVQILQGFPDLTQPEVPGMLAEIARAVTRLEGVVDALSDVARGAAPEALNSQPLSLHALLMRVLKPYRDELAKRRLHVHCDLRDLPQVHGDAAALAKVFDQLVSNAIKYTPDGGTMTINGEALLEAGQRFVHVIIADRGIGIAPEHREAVFAPFFRVGPAALHSSGRTKFKGGGPGLGLSLARAVVEAHGGRMWVESPGYDEVTCPGSTVYLVLPA